MEVISELLPNGIRVYLAKMEGFRTSSIGFWIAAGSRGDPNGKRGIAHLLEHLLFKGTLTRSASEIAELIDRIGGELDGYTEREMTVIWAKALSRYTYEVVDLISDLVFHPSFTPEDVEREKGIVLEEMKIYEDDPEEFGYDELIKAVVGTHPIGNPVLGVWEDIERIGHDDLLSYWASSYSPSRIVVSAAGPIEQKELMKALKERVPDGPCEVRKEDFHHPPRLSRRDVFLERDGFEETYIFLGTLGASRREVRKRVILEILAGALAGGVSSRLFMEVRERMGMVYNISSSSTSFTDIGVFDISFSCKSDRACKVLELVGDRVERARRNGFDRDEVERAKSVLESSIIMGLESPEGVMRWMGYFGLLDGYIPDEEELLSIVSSVREEEVSSMAGEILDPARISMVAVGDLGWRR